MSVILDCILGLIFFCGVVSVLSTMSFSTLALIAVIYFLFIK